MPETSNICISVKRKYIAPATINGTGNVGKMTSLPGQMKVPNPTNDEIAADAPTPILPGSENTGMNMERLPAIPPKK